MQISYRRIICLILAVLMLFSGICLDGNKADTVFASSPVGSSGSIIDSLEDEIIENQSCTIEMLGVRNASNIVKALRRSSLKIDVKMSVILFCAGLFAQNLSILYAVNDTTSLPDLYYKTAVLSYIQSIDGKK